MSADFLKDVEAIYDTAAQNLSLPDGLAEKIKVCNATDVTRFDARLCTEGWSFITVEEAMNDPIFLLLTFARVQEIYPK